MLSWADSLFHQIEFDSALARYRDALVGFLGPEDQAAYGSSRFWDEIRLRAVSVLEEAIRDEG